MASEPMTLEQALAYLKPADANNGTISLRAPKAREAVEVIAAEIAALQSRAFEDGARWMKAEALAAVEPWIVSTPAPISPSLKSRARVSSGIHTAIAALPLQPEGERNA